MHKNESFFDYVLNYLTTLHELLRDADMKLSVEIKNLQESLSFKDSLIIIIAAMILIWLMQTDEWVALCFRKDFWERHGANITSL